MVNAVQARRQNKSIAKKQPRRVGSFSGGASLFFEGGLIFFLYGTPLYKV